MSVLSVARCAACSAMVNPNWSACLVCGQGVSARQAMAVHSPKKATPLPELAAAYRRYWNLPKTQPMEVFQAAYLEIVRLEAQSIPEMAWQTLREAATAYHAETGICPFCKKCEELHLPAEQMARELSGG